VNKYIYIYLYSTKQTAHLIHLQVLSKSIEMDHFHIFE